MSETALPHNQLSEMTLCIIYILYTCIYTPSAAAGIGVSALGGDRMDMFSTETAQEKNTPSNLVSRFSPQSNLHPLPSPAVFITVPLLCSHYGWASSQETKFSSAIIHIYM